MDNKRILSRTIIEAEEKERDRLGAELHDNVNQLLVCASLLLGLERKSQTIVSENLANAHEQIKLAIEEIRVLTHSLTTTFISNEGLQKSIDEIVRSFWQVKSIRIKTDVSKEAISKLSSGQQLMVYRIIQEQTNNILKYAQTQKAIISIKEYGSNIKLIIFDQGIGFDKTLQKLSGIGFTNIHNRVIAYNGTFHIVTSPGKGCKLVITFPLNEG
jgi:signal transduction histidine kinase